MADEETPVEVKKLQVTITISSLGNERRTIRMGAADQESVDAALNEIHAAFGIVRVNNALRLTDSTGLTTIANLDNIAFVEVQVV